MAIVRASPAFVLAVWEREVGHDLSAQRRQLFVERHEVGELCKLPTYMVEDTARLARQRNEAGHLLLVEWLDVAAEELDMMLARTEEARSRPSGRGVVDREGPQDDESESGIATQGEPKDGQTTGWPQQVTPAPRLASASLPQVVRKQVSYTRNRPCLVCGKRSFHDYDCSRKGAEFEVEPGSLVREEIEFVYSKPSEPQKSVPSAERPIHGRSAAEAEPPSRALVSADPAEPRAFRMKIAEWVRRRSRRR